MPAYNLTSPKTGKTYKVNFDGQPSEIDMEEAIAHFDGAQPQSKDRPLQPDQTAENQNPENSVSGTPSFGTRLKESFLRPIQHPIRTAAEAFRGTYEANRGLGSSLLESGILRPLAGIPTFKEGTPERAEQEQAASMFIDKPVGIIGGAANALLSPTQAFSGPLGEIEAQIPAPIKKSPLGMILPNSPSIVGQTAKTLVEGAAEHPIQTGLLFAGARGGTKPSIIKGGTEIGVPGLGPLTDMKNALFNKPRLSEEISGSMPSTPYNVPKTTPPAAVTAMQKSMGQYLREGGKAPETASRVLDTVTDAGFQPTNAYDNLIAMRLTINRLGPKIREMAQQVGDEKGLKFRTRDIARDAIEDYIKSKNGFRGIQGKDQIVENLRSKYESLANESLMADELFQNVSTRSQQLGSKAKKIYGEFLGEESIAKGDPDLWGDKIVLDAFRKNLIDGVESGGGNNIAYREMRKNFGALIRAYDAQLKRMSVVDRQNALSLYEGLGLIGAATHITSPTIAGLTALAGKGIKLFNNPHAQTSKAYRLTAKAKSKLPKSPQAQLLSEPTGPLKNESPGYSPPQEKVMQQGLYKEGDEFQMIDRKIRLSRVQADRLNSEIKRSGNRATQKYILENVLNPEGNGIVRLRP